MSKTKRLSLDQQVNVAKLRKAGHKIVEIKQMTGLSNGAICNSLDRFDKELKITETLNKEMVEKEVKARMEIAELMPSHSIKAIRVHEKVMDSFLNDPEAKKNVSQAVDIAKDTLDRTSGKPIQRNINVNQNLDIDSSKLQKMLSDKGFSRVLDNL